MRDGLAWSSLDKYIKNIEGGGPGAAGLQAHPNDDAAAAVTAAGVADSEEDAHAGMTFRVKSVCIECDTTQDGLVCHDIG